MLRNVHKLRETLQGKYKLVWTKHAKERMEERFSKIPLLQEIDFSNGTARICRTDKDKRFVISIREGNNYYNLVAAQDGPDPKTLQVVTATEDSIRSMSIIKDLF